MNSLFDIGIRTCNYHGERICGDTVIFNRYEGKRHSVIVLSDGMGHGAKANVLSTLSASMLANLTHDGAPIETIAGMILGSLPVCSVRKVSYATFSLIVIDHDTHEVIISEYDNPKAILLRGRNSIPTDYQCKSIDSNCGRECKVRINRFVAQPGDLMMIMSDGVAQSGLGTPRYPFGWGRDSVRDFVLEAIGDTSLTADEISTAVVAQSIENDKQRPKDDISCVVVRFL